MSQYGYLQKTSLLFAVRGYDDSSNIKTCLNTQSMMLHRPRSQSFRKCEPTSMTENTRQDRPEELNLSFYFVKQILIREKQRRQYSGHNNLIAIILTAAQWALVSIMAKGCIVA